MRSRIIKIVSACCVIVFIVAGRYCANGLRQLVSASASRFESVAAWSPMSKGASGAYNTTDRYLSSLQISNPSEAALKAMADVPPEDAMVFITSSADEGSELVYRTVAYLGWPRPIGEARCGGAGKAPELFFHPRAGKPVKWLFFYRIKPPPELTQTSRTIGPYLVLAPSPELKDWKSYCSR